MASRDNCLDHKERSAMQRNKAVIWGTLLLTLLLCILALALPTPADWPADNVEFHQQLIVNIIMATTHTGGAILLLTNLDVYKAGLRRAYIILAFGTLITGLGTLQISVLTLLSAWTTPYGTSGATMLPFLLSGVIMYLGVRSFARLLDTRHFLTKAWIVLPGAFLLALSSTLLPHAYDPRLTEATYDVLVAISAWSGSLMLLAGWLSYTIRLHTGAHYIHAMTWLTRALIFSGFILLYQGAYTLANDSFNPFLNLVSNTITVVSGLLWVRAGYAFALTKYVDENISIVRFMLSQSAPSAEAHPDTVLDMVTYAAGLVSNSRDIDPLLDNVRAITARLKPGEAPSAEDKQSLVSTYLKIEQYLITKEMIRSYTQEELRAHLDPKLQKLIASHPAHKTK